MQSVDGQNADRVARLHVNNYEITKHASVDAHRKPGYPFHWDYVGPGIKYESN